MKTATNIHLGPECRRTIIVGIARPHPLVTDDPCSSRPDCRAGPGKTRFRTDRGHGVGADSPALHHPNVLDPVRSMQGALNGHDEYVADRH